MDEIIEKIINKIKVDGIALDSRKAGKNHVFVAVKGSETDGKLFIEEALSRGASVVITEDKCILPERIKHFVVPDARRFVGLLSEAFYGYPSRKLKAIGVTGTNGKTTTTYLVEAILKKAGRKTGRLGTINYSLGNRQIPSETTTPDPVSLSAMLQEMVKSGFDSVVMEVSSHAISQQRASAIDFDYGVFTSLASDHLDYHGTREEYVRSKIRFFQNLKKESIAIVNRDDRAYKAIKRCAGGDLLTYGRSIWAGTRYIKMRPGREGMSFVVKYKKERFEVHIPMIGRFNVQNALAAVCVGKLEGISSELICRALEEFEGVPGRCEIISTKKDFGVMIDYAHTEDSLKQVLEAARQITKGRLIVVFGCGGNRDISKRMPMGRIASTYADYSLITSDNPRKEDPMDIIRQVQKGFRGNTKSFEADPDRKKAIKRALGMAKKDDLIIIAGKGHENYQEIGSTFFPHSDKQVVLEMLEETAKSGNSRDSGYDAANPSTSHSTGSWS